MCVCVSAWMHVRVHMSVYTLWIHAFVLVCASESSWGKLVVSPLPYLQVHPWCFLSLPGHSHSHRGILWLIAKYMAVVSDVGNSLCRIQPFWSIEKQYLDMGFYSFMLTFIKVLICHLQFEMLNYIDIVIDIKVLISAKSAKFVDCFLYCLVLVLTYGSTHFTTIFFLYFPRNHWTVI